METLTPVHIPRGRPTSLAQKEFKVREWLHDVDQNIPFEAVLNPEYWSHLAGKLTAGDIIHIRPVEGSYYAELYVRSVAKLSAIVAPLRVVVFDKIKKDPPSTDLCTKFRGAAKWSVMRGNDVLEDRIDTKEQADTRMAELKAASQAA